MRAVARAIALVACVAFGCAPAPLDAPTDPLARAVRWLWSRQQPDGSWRSENYALLRSGQAMTPFVLHALLAVPESRCRRPAGGVHRALGFIRARARDDGALGYSVPDVLEYPVYATSYALQVLVRAGDAGDDELIQRMAAWLASMQLDAGEGFTPADPAWGGWGFGAQGLPPRTAGYMDLAHTRRALQALRAADWGDPATFARAAQFLVGMQNDDGGFYFSPVIAGANKGRGDPEGYRSYATATCDGLLATRAAGGTGEHAALDWLRRHGSLAAPAGIPVEHSEPWGDALFFYHHAVRVEAQGLDVARDLAAIQRDDGSFANDRSVLMKEDDPLLATALSVIALAGVVR